jgi:transaldolase
MGASFRNTSQILALAGCDLLTISPELLAELQGADGKVEHHLSVEQAKKSAITKVPLDEKAFRWMLNEDAMGTEKLAEGIRKFTEDIIKLEGLIAARLG